VSEQFLNGTSAQYRICRAILSKLQEFTIGIKNNSNMAGKEAKYRLAQRQAKEMMDGQYQGGCRSQMIYTEGD